VDGCVFCDIVAGRAPASVVWADDAVVEFADLRQPTAGHVLVVPRAHVETIDGLPLDVLLEEGRWSDVIRLEKLASRHKPSGASRSPRRREQITTAG